MFCCVGRSSGSAVGARTTVTLIFACLLALAMCTGPVLVAAADTPTTTTAADDGSLRWAILLDLTRSEMTLGNFTKALSTFIAKSERAMVRKLFAQPPMILNSDGDLITALSEVNRIITNASTFPDVLFLAETTDVSTAVVDILRKDAKAASILIVSAHTSNSKLCDATMNPRTMCMVPRDMINVRSVLEVVSSQLRWYSMAMVYTNTGYGQGVQGMVASQVEEATTTPTVVAELFMNPSTTDAEDDALVAEIMKHKPKGIACFVLAEQMSRLRAAFARAGLAKSVFLIGSREALNLMRDLKGSLQPLMPAWGALIASTYTTPERFFEKRYFDDTIDVDDYGAYILSHLFDGMTMVAEAKGTASMPALRAVRFTGFSGTVAFDPVYYQRVEATFSLIMEEYPVTNPLVTWYLQSYAVPAVTVNRNSVATQQLIPPSPLRSLPVCMTSPSSCSDAMMMSAMLYVLLQHNENTSTSADDASFLPVAINTGQSGVAGLSALIPVARTCGVLTGPGLASITIALTPVINEFKVSQIDYSTANDFFTTDTLTYPYFSRTIPPNSFSYMAYAEVCAHFAWERVIIISSEDQVGTSRTTAMSNAMEMRNIYVEKTYGLDDVNIATITDTLNSIYKTDVSRIIVFLLPLSGDNAAAFFDLIDKLPFMDNYVFLLSKDVCLYAAAYPSHRKRLVSSICFYPEIPQERLALLNEQIRGNPKIQREVKTILSDGKFLMQAETCRIETVEPFSGFAVDAAYVIIDAVKRALASNVTLSNSANLRSYIRGASIDNFTGPFSIDAKGNRVFAVYYADIQLPNGSLQKLGVWNEKRSPAFSKTYTTDFMWMTNQTSVPLDTFRDYSFVLGTTVSASPGTIVLSVLGFVCTIAVFFFCYRHYRMQKLIELTLVSNDVPVTEEELRRLRGSVDDI